MPFGTKDSANGPIDFQAVFNDFIKPLVNDLGFAVERCLDVDAGGSIHEKMFAQIYEADMVLVDLTTGNPNVMYELGVRHALTKGITVMIKQPGCKVPFNISGYEAVEYNPTDPSSLATVRRRLNDIIAHARKAGNHSDSPVLSKLPINIQEENKEISDLTIHRFKLHEHPHDEIRLITGDIKNVKNIKIWVNSENTHMLMARYLEKTISSFIRYWGAKRDDAGSIVEDTIFEELQTQKGTRATVDPGCVLVTGSGMLAASHGVQKIFHAATTIGTPTNGLNAIKDLSICIYNAMAKADSLAKTDTTQKLDSILFPLIGTGQARGKLEIIGASILRQAISYLNANPNCEIDHVYFLTQTERQLHFCLNYLRSQPDLQYMGTIGHL